MVIFNFLKTRSTLNKPNADTNTGTELYPYRYRWLIAFLFVQWVAVATFAQVRYKDEVFAANQVEVDTSVRFTGQKVPAVAKYRDQDTIIGALETNTKNVHLFMDIYSPQNDTVTNRPVIIFCFGGGFVAGHREEEDMKLLAKGMAQKGYVAAVIDYRTGTNVLNNRSYHRAVYRAAQDSRTAVRFFRKYKNTYGINSDKIIIAGHSAGAVTALNNIYLDGNTFYEDHAEGNNLVDLGNWDKSGGHTTKNGKANAVVAFAGALFKTDYITNSNVVPTLLFYNDNDPTVDPGYKRFHSGIFTSPFMPKFYGSEEIAARRTQLGISGSTFQVIECTRTAYESSTGHFVHMKGGGDYNDAIETGTPELNQAVFDKMVIFLYNKLSLAQLNARIATSQLNQFAQHTMAYPNPATSEVTLQVSEAEAVSIYNLRGQLVLSQPLASKQIRINISHLKPGTYLMHIRQKNGTLTSQRIVKK